MTLEHTSQIDALLKSNQLAEASRYIHEVALFAKKKHQVSGKQNQLFEPYKNELKDMKYVHLDDDEIKQQIKIAKEMEVVNESIKNQILATVEDDIADDAEK